MVKRKKAHEQQAQRYDSSFKDWLQQQPQNILPLLLPGTVYEETLNVEVIRPTMREDKVFRVQYAGQEHIFHLEFESGVDSEMTSRLLVYNAILYRDHRLPVISMIIYPFRIQMAETPLRVMSGPKELLTFHFLTLPLFTLDAQRYVDEHVACMYPLLPTMQGANAALIRQAMDELATLYRDNEVTLSQQFVWMEVLLERTDTVPPNEKSRIQEQLHMYDPLWEDHPKVKKIRAESRAEGMAEGFRKAVLNIISIRYPNIAEIAQTEITRIKKPDALELLHRQIETAPDEEAVLWLLRTSTSQAS